MVLNRLAMETVVVEALNEDIGFGDWTTECIFAPGHESRGRFQAKKEGIIAGLWLLPAIFQKLDGRVQVESLVADGDRVMPGAIVATVCGPTRAILSGERVALNFLQHLSGIATQTRELVDLVQGYKAKIIDTRKTLPGLRMLQKYAVRAGGGLNHRYGLDQAVLIKDNHIAAAGGIKEAVERVRRQIPITTMVEVEVENLAMLEEALACEVELIMLDNMTVAAMRQAVELAAGRAMLEASGGITRDNVVSVAATGVDLISVGAITHSVRALDVSLDLDQ